MTESIRTKRILLWVVLGSILALLAALGDAFLYEPTAYVARRVTLHAPRLPDAWVGRKILLFSDTHLGLGMSAKDVEKFGAKMAEESPDLVLFLGDAVDSRTPDDEAFLVAAGEAFGRVQAPLGKYAVVGNHDGEAAAQRDEFRTVMRSGGFQVLENQAVTVDGILLGGIAEAYFGDPDISAVFPDGDDDVCKILMAHQPKLGMSDHVLAYAAPDLIFSGHTHGGQATFFGLSPKFYERILGPYINGAYTTRGTSVFVTKGVGSYALKARFFCRPEYVVVTLAK